MPGTIAPVGPLRPVGAQAVEGHNFLNSSEEERECPPNVPHPSICLRSSTVADRVTEQSWNSGS